MFYISRKEAESRGMTGRDVLVKYCEAAFDHAYVASDVWGSWYKFLEILPEMILDRADMDKLASVFREKFNKRRGV